MIEETAILISIRHLKVILCLAEIGNVSRAAHMLLRSRTAVSKALSDLEKQIGVKIFNRSQSGYVPTPEGDALLSRARVIDDIFSRLSKSYQLAHKRPRNVNRIPLFTMDIATKRLMQLALLADTESIEKAAKLAKLSTSAIYKSVHDLEGFLDLPLFARLPNGRVIPLEFGELLCQQVKLVLSQLRHALDDIKIIRGEHDGVLRIGSLPSMGTYVLPVALAKLTRTHSEITIHIDSRSYTEMEKDLLSGDLDVILGGIRSGSDTEGLETRTLAEDQIILAAGAHHPLAMKKNLSKEDLEDVIWVLPLSGTPSRKLFTQILRKSGIDPEKVWIESGSTTTKRGILMSSDAIIIGSKYQIQYEQSLGLLKRLLLELADSSWPTGLILRQDAPPPKSFDFFLSCLRETLNEVQQGVALDSQGWKPYLITT